MLYVLVPKTGTNSYHQAMKKKYSFTLPDGKGEPINRATQSRHPVFSMPPKISMFQHLMMRHAKTLIDKEIWDSYEKIGFIRNPYDWVQSVYCQGGITKVIDEDTRKSFSEFIKNLKLTPFSWLTNEKGDILADTIWRTEDIKKFCEKYDVEYSHKHKTRRAKPKFTDELRAIVDEKFKREWAYY